MINITNNTKIRDLTVGELKEIIKDAIEENTDDDVVLEFNEEFIQSVMRSLQDEKQGKVYTLEQVKQRLEIHNV
ncbi:hypothetical protein MCHI_002779 [Candidatus Magnetoovum chiemensis]|nr:hypothetical protein MCHI_002779 [Candidatus Magnetoovum chiemensis]